MIHRSQWVLAAEPQHSLMLDDIQRENVGNNLHVNQTQSREPVKAWMTWLEGSCLVVYCNLFLNTIMSMSRQLKIIKISWISQYLWEHSLWWSQAWWHYWWWWWADFLAWSRKNSNWDSVSCPLTGPAQHWSHSSSVDNTLGRLSSSKLSVLICDDSEHLVMDIKYLILCRLHNILLQWW